VGRTLLSAEVAVGVAFVLSLYVGPPALRRPLERSSTAPTALGNTSTTGLPARLVK
jgi:hypothetical protein